MRTGVRGCVFSFALFFVVGCGDDDSPGGPGTPNTMDGGPLLCTQAEATGYSCTSSDRDRICHATWICGGMEEGVTCAPLDEGRCVLEPSGEVCYTYPDPFPCMACLNVFERCEPTPL